MLPGVAISAHGRRLGRALRALRIRAGLRQVDLARLAGISDSTISRVELGDIDGVAVSTLMAVFEAVGARVEIRPLWHGAAMDRLLDEGHANLSALVLDMLRRRGWETELEVSFSHYGDRGSIDILAWHATSGTLLVIEIKTEIGSVEGLLRPLDVKVRLAARLATERFGWRCARVARLVVVPESETVRRQVRRHAKVFESALPDGSRGVRRWLRSPDRVLRGLWFLSDPRQGGVVRNPSAVRRVSRPGARAS